MSGIFNFVAMVVSAWCCGWQYVENNSGKAILFAVIFGIFFLRDALDGKSVNVYNYDHCIFPNGKENETDGK